MSRAMLKAEEVQLMKNISQLWEADESFSMEMALVVNKVTCAILNPSE
jgi:hypothetical protein